MGVEVTPCSHCRGDGRTGCSAAAGAGPGLTAPAASGKFVIQKSAGFKHEKGLVTTRWTSLRNELGFLGLDLSLQRLNHAFVGSCGGWSLMWTWRLYVCFIYKLSVIIFLTNIPLDIGWSPAPPSSPYLLCPTLVESNMHQLGPGCDQLWAENPNYGIGSGKQKSVSVTKEDAEGNSRPAQHIPACSRHVKGSTASTQLWGITQHCSAHCGAASKCTERSFKSCYCDFVILSSLYGVQWYTMEEKDELQPTDAV